MSETPTKPTTADPSSLYPPDGGAAAAAAAQAATQTAATGGDDTVRGGSGNDTVAASGNDTVTAPAGNDTVAGAETGTAATGADTLAAGAGNDTVAAPEYDFKLPEGFTENAELQTEAKTVFAAAGVPADKAQGLIDLFGKAVKASNDATTTAFNTEQQTWLSEINAMPEFQGPTRETSLQAIGRVFDEYGTPEAKAALNSHGVGNNPALVKMMLKMANALTEGRPVPAAKPAPNSNGRQKPQTVGQSLYPDQ